MRAIALGLGVLLVAFGALDMLLRLSGTEGLVPGAASAAVPLARPLNRVLTETLTPTRLSIPSLDVDASVEALGLNASGNMAAPTTYYTVAWYKDGPKPGEAGNTVIAGHLDNSLGLAGVFYKLDQLQFGDTIVVRGEEGEARYAVRSMTVYDAENAPNEEIFATEGPSRLVLITCDGAWREGTRSYDKRLIVVAELI